MYAVANNDEKEYFNLLLTVNAARYQAPPMVVFKYKRIPRKIVNEFPEGWAIGRSENGWITGATFLSILPMFSSHG